MHANASHGRRQHARRPRRTWRAGAMWVVSVAALAPGAGAAPAAVDDDLAVVRRAVAARAAVAQSPTRNSVVATSARRGAAAPAPAGRERNARERDRRWLRVRIVEKGAREEVLSLRLPLCLARSCGELDRSGDGSRRARSSVREVLRALDPGQDVVRVDDGDTLVRVWVE